MVFLIPFVLCTGFIINISWAYDIEDQFDAMNYLARFGYMDKSLVNDMSLVDVRPYLLQFQKLIGINETGELDQETMMMMNKPRCGVVDVPISDNSPESRHQRFATLGTKWPKRELVYKISKYSVMDHHFVDKDVEQAFRLWERVTDLTFVKALSSSQKVDIDLKFSSDIHEDPYPFDGPGATLAHAFPPGEGLGGDVHFDDHEQWSTESSRGTNLLYVSVHEIGHALGLGHSAVRGSIMQAIYGGYRPNLKLHNDDILGIQRLYGPRSTGQSSPISPRISPPRFPDRFPSVKHHFPRFPLPPSRETMPTTAVTRRPFNRHGGVIQGFTRVDICVDPKMDAITTISNEIYLFKGIYVYKMDRDGGGLVPGWPNRVEFIFKGLHGAIDAALTRKESGYTFFFKHDKYWSFNGTTMGHNYPKETGRHFPGIPDNIDAAFEWPHDGHMYFFKDDKFWGFSPFELPHVASKYPLHISSIGLNVKFIDGAFVAPHGKTYLFKNNHYWRLADNVLRVDQVEPPYPRDSRLMWWKCTQYRPELKDI